MRAIAVWTLVAVSAFAQPRTSRCWQACERNVADPRARANACTACLTHPEDPAAWLVRAPVSAAQLLGDPDWAVRWAGVEWAARPPGPSVATVLRRWAADAPELACITAAHGAGLRGHALAGLLGADNPCAAKEEAIVTGLEQDLYAESAGLRAEALRHLGTALGRPLARVVLEAMQRHPAAFDALVLDTLAEVTLEGPRTVPAQLLDVAGPGDVPMMNRAMANFSALATRARGRRSSAEAPQREQAMRELAALAPLTDDELLLALEGPPVQRRIAARGLARGRGETVAGEAAARLTAARPATVAQQRALLEVMADAQEPDCAPRALALWASPVVAPALRQRSLTIAAGCDWGVARAEVERQFREVVDPDVLAAAVAALGHAPLHPQINERLEFALRHPAPVVRASACQAVAQRHWRAPAARLQVLSRDEAPVVRSAALEALDALDTPAVDLLLGQQLERDAAAEVRSAAARLLGHHGGPRSLAALSRAAESDADPNVRFVAAQSLRRLKGGTPP